VAVTVIVGCQWGDEGKGKIVDVLASQSDIVARYQGGSNAGHTVVIGDKKFIFHMLPSGVLHPGVVNVLGNGVVLDLGSLAAEIESLNRENIDITGRLLLSEQAHLILPLHKALDAAYEDAMGDGKIGTTRKGIGLAYGDKIRRIGIRLGDARHKDVFARKYRNLWAWHGEVMKDVFKVEPPPLEETLEQLLAATHSLLPHVTDTVTYLNDAIRAGKNVLCEGAQGVLLDIDHGTYPFVTSSSPTAGGACVGLGIPPRCIDRVIGIVKAYTTRVGSGPMPTELHDEDGVTLRERGSEFGATTGRPRRCGWMDLPVVRRAFQITGATEVVITKLDVLDEYESIRLCTHYEGAGRQHQYMPFDIEDLETIKPVYEDMAGWNEPTTDVRRREDLPANALAYLERLEREFGVPISMVSTGPARDATMTFTPVGS
jgi:adenylosuccinate synthase